MFNRFIVTFIASMLVVVSSGMSVNARSTGSSTSPSSSSSSTKSTPSYSSPSAPTKSAPSVPSFSSPTRSPSFSSPSNPTSTPRPNQSSGINNLRGNSTPQPRPTVQRVRVTVPTLSPETQRETQNPKVVKVFQSAPRSFESEVALNNYLRKQQRNNDLNQAQILVLQSQLMSRSTQQKLYTEQPVFVQPQPAVLVDNNQDEDNGFGDLMWGFINFIFWCGVWIAVGGTLYYLTVTFGPKVQAWIKRKKKDNNNGF